MNDPRNCNHNFHVKKSKTNLKRAMLNITLIFAFIFIVTMTFRSSSTYSKTNSKQTTNHSRKCNLSLNSVRLHCPHWKTRNRSAIHYHDEFIEFVDSAKIFEHTCSDCTKNHRACEKCSQTVVHLRRTRGDSNRHGRMCHTMKMSADVSSPTKSKINIDLVHFKDDNYFCDLDDEIKKNLMENVDNESDERNKISCWMELTTRIMKSWLSNHSINYTIQTDMTMHAWHHNVCSFNAEIIMPRMCKCKFLSGRLKLFKIS